jgi:hypothetical protein
LNSSKIDNNYISDIQVISTTHLTKTIEALQITSDYDMGHFLVLLTKEKLSRGYDTDDDIYIEIVSKSSKIFVPAFSTQFDSSHTHQVHGEIYYVP